MSIEEGLCSQEALLKLDDIELQENTLSYKDTVTAFNNESASIRELTSTSGQKILFTLTGKLKSISVVTNEDQIFVEKNEWSKELRQIDSLQLFDAYFKNAYIKTIPLNDGTVKLEVKQRIVGGIPPLQLPNAQLQSTAQTHHQGEEAQKQLQVNYAYESLSPRAVNINNLPHIITNHQVVNNNSGIECYILDNADKAVGWVPPTGNSLHKSEEASLQILFSNNLAARQVVLLEIFDLGKSNKVSFDKPGVVKTHFVVLWQTAQNKVIVIEPNNIGFSKRLVGALDNMLTPRNIDVEHYHNGGGSLYGLKYGNKHEEYFRDCRDVAAKIALEIKYLLQNQAQIYNNDIIKTILFNISNQPKLLAEYINTAHGATKTASTVEKYRAEYFNELSRNSSLSGIAVNRAELASNMVLKRDARNSFIQGLIH